MAEYSHPQVVGIGSTVYDTLMVVDRYPTEDTKLEGIETKVQGGGPCATALVAAQKLGIPAAYAGTVGDDPFGTFMMEDLRRWGVDTTSVQVIPGAVSFHAVVFLNQATQSRTCIWNPGTVPQPKPEDIPDALLENAKVLHLDGHMLPCAISCAKRCRALGVKVSYDAGGTYPGVEHLLPHVDWLIPSQEYALKMTGCDTAEAAAQTLWDTYHPELVVLTQGVKGGLLLDEKGLRRYASFPVTVVDSNGCGDTFHGAFVAGKLRGYDNDEACRYASAAAAVKCTRLGARFGMATHEECLSFLQERGCPLP